jgi:hypothetical protein
MSFEAQQSPDEIEHLEEVAEVVANRECILFLGAGVHFPPPEPKPGEIAKWDYPESHRPPLGKTLAAHLAKEINLFDERPEEKDYRANLGRMAMFYEREKGRKMLIDQITAAVEKGKFGDHVRQTKPSPVVRALAEMPFRMVITTNYDRLFERSLPADKTPQYGIYKPNIKKAEATFNLDTVPDENKPFIYKLHGDINERESIVITDEDYIHFILRMSDTEKFHPVPKLFRSQFAEWPTLFIGYSLQDYNLRVLIRTLLWKLDVASLPTMYSVDLKPDPLIEYFYGTGPTRYVWFITKNLWTVVPALYQRVMGKEMPA